MTETAIKAEGVTPEQMARLRDGGWEDDRSNSPGWTRYVGDERDGWALQWVYPKEDGNWRGYPKGADNPDGGLFHTLDASLDHCEMLTPQNSGVRPADAPCTEQATRFASGNRGF